MRSPINRAFAEQFCQQLVESNLLKWVKLLIKQNHGYDKLFLKKELFALHLPMDFPKGSIVEIYDKIIKLQKLFSEAIKAVRPQDPLLLTHIDLLLQVYSSKKTQAIGHIYQSYINRYPVIREAMNMQEKGYLYREMKQAIVTIENMPMNNVDELTKNNLMSEAKLFIEAIQFHHYDYNKQLRLLDEIAIFCYEGTMLTLRNCDALDTECVTKLIESAPNLKNLILINCRNISPNVIEYVRDYNENLKITIREDSHHVQQIDEISDEENSLSSTYSEYSSPRTKFFENSTERIQKKKIKGKGKQEQELNEVECKY